MGLDMYLNAKKHISNYDFRPEDKQLNHKIKEALGLTGFDDDGTSVEVSINIGYWRKANQIHKWFVDTCQGGVDDCREAWVGREQLEKLFNLCDEALTKKNANIFPPQAGFFFGSTEVDEWYWQDISETKSMLEKVLANEQLQDYTFYYHSSW